MASQMLKENVAAAAEADHMEDRPIDLVHLSRQSLGDRDLEIELLNLFDRQAEQIMARLKSECGAGDRRWRHDLSHTLKGSARAVGAARVARAAQVYEALLYGTANEESLQEAVGYLDDKVKEAQERIRELVS